MRLWAATGTANFVEGACGWRLRPRMTLPCVVTCAFVLRFNVVCACQGMSTPFVLS